MKRRPVILITLIIVLPLVALTWAVLRIAENEQVVVQARFRELMEDRLNDVNANVVTYFDQLERSLSNLAAIDDYDVNLLRQINRRGPQLLQLFVLGPRGELNYPNPMAELNSNERLFLIQAAKMFTGQDLKTAVLRAEGGSDPTSRRPSAAAASDESTLESVRDDSFLRSALPTAAERPSSSGGVQDAQVQMLPAELPAEREPEMQQRMVQEAYQAAPIQNLEAFSATSGWFVWYWDRGLNLIYWQRRPTGHIVGCALERSRWMADLIAQLPETVSTASGSDGPKLRNLATRVRLVNSSADSVYQWGAYEPPEGVRPLCEVPLVEPLASWRLQCFVPPEQILAGTGRSVYLSLFAGVLGVAAALAAIAWVFVREYAKDMRAAAQQVSFVNQVSHELKTPLTNISMYAELLQRDLEDEQLIASADLAKPKQRLNVILSEGQRLSRLIGNVLTFARQQRKTLQLQPRDIVPDELISRIIERFRPALLDQQIEIETDLQAEQAMRIDPDIVEQVLGNLISNVEKYAASGGLLNIKSRLQNGQLFIDVRDAGPGIEPAMRDKVFEPFARVSNRVSYAAGTGIGLTIARELARLHGGDVRLLKVDQGCLFRTTLVAQPPRQESESS